MNLLSFLLMTAPKHALAVPAAHVQNLVATEQTTPGATSLILAPVGKTVTVGNTIVLLFGSASDITASGVVDNLGNTYSRVERLRNAGGDTADLWAAPVTFGGSITSITVSFPSTQYVIGIASEFSGVAGSPAVGSGATGNSTTATWATNKTIPANGLAVGAVHSNSVPNQTAGAASGTPSTTIYRSAYVTGTYVAGLFYAIAGGSAVSNFNGTTVVDTVNRQWAGAGSIFPGA